MDKFSPELLCRGLELPSRELYRVEVQCKLVMSNLGFLAAEEMFEEEEDSSQEALSLLTGDQGTEESYVNVLTELRHQGRFQEAVQAARRMNLAGISLSESNRKALWHLYDPASVGGGSGFIPSFSGERFRTQTACKVVRLNLEDNAAG